MSEETVRLGLPLLAAGQAQKEMTHNEALQLLDLLVQCSVEEPPRDAPPDDPATGSCWLVGASPTGAWSGQAQRLAMWIDGGGWRFAAPREGHGAWIAAGGTQARYLEGAWRIDPAASPIAAPSSGTVVDAEARATLVAVLARLRELGLVAA